MIFNHNDMAIPNGNFFAMPYKKGEGDIEIITVPWDATVSYGEGASRAPEAVIDASTQIDLFDVDIEKAWEIKISHRSLDLETDNRTCRSHVQKVLKHLLDGGKPSDIQNYIDQVNIMSEQINSRVYEAAVSILEQKKIPALTGGDHSCPFGLIKAVAEYYPQVGILHIDAHADLRQGYQGFKYSHASIMYNVYTQIPNISTIVQVAVRDFCEEEYTFASNHADIFMLTDSCLSEKRYAGKNWIEQCSEIINHLPEYVYISFDIDGLNPYLCPSTGTPVPGGLDFSEALCLIKQLAVSGKKIAGFDLCEVVPGNGSEWDANVAARLLFKICCYTYYSQHKKI
ncbi:MAG: agmatinase family protein [Prevotellaceae bacterium]|jgi:agmatinase|nr:agmatinase family protein [Prevotellaceae bacterium]